MPDQRCAACWPSTAKDPSRNSYAAESHTPDSQRSLEKRRVAVALQGGGSHGAFTWGVLDRLLEEPKLEIVGISGTSAGAMNAGILADGLRCGGAARARVALRQYWEDVGHLPGYGSLWHLATHRNWHLDHNPAYLWAGMLTHVWSPYQLNPLNYHPLRELLQRIDFEGLRHDPSAARLFVCATNVRTGLRRVFHNAELSVDVLLASACLPQLYQAVQIDENSYWDGGYTGNPALAPLYLGTSATDVIVVGINPFERTTVPQTTRSIMDRINEISFDLHARIGSDRLRRGSGQVSCRASPIQTPSLAWHRRRRAGFVRRVEQDEQ